MAKNKTVKAGQLYLGTHNWKPKHSLGQGSLVNPRQVETERCPNNIKWRKPKRAVLTKKIEAQFPDNLLSCFQ